MFQLKRFIYFLLVICAAIAAHHYVHYPQNTWLVGAALMLSLVSAGDTWVTRVTVMALTGFIAALSVWVVASLPVSWVWVSLVFITAVCLSIGKRYPHYAFSAVIINVGVIMTAYVPIAIPDPLILSLAVIAGTVIAITSLVITWPGYASDQYQAEVHQAWLDLEGLNQEIFACFVQPDYAENTYLYERRLHVQKNQLMQALMRLHQLGDHGDAVSKRWHQWMGLYQNMIDYAQLRWRVTDHTIFAVCATELSGIQAEISRLLTQLATAKPIQLDIDVSALVEKIRALEDVYENVVQVAAREPLVFLLFIASLKKFSDTIAAFSDMPSATLLKWKIDND